MQFFYTVLMKKRLTKWLKYLTAFAVLVVALTFYINYKVEKSTAPSLYTHIQDIPYNKVGLLLGTSKFLSNGNTNLFYKFRIEAALALFRAGKIDFVLVSGDNRHRSYNEPEQMMNDLVAGGIPQEKIFLDYAGFRTLDSILRCKEVFGEDKITVISQQFHNERALYIAQHKGMEALGFNAETVSAKVGLKVYIREYLARVKMVLDLITNKQPRFYGPTIEIK